tara:strand:+ start:123 stop:314 length:192 start_codon:yes stop_codon:yes gene_type:complete
MTKKKKKSPIDTLIIDLIMEHYNDQTLDGKHESLTGDDFMEIVVVAEQIYYEGILTDVNVGIT